MSSSPEDPPLSAEDQLLPADPAALELSPEAMHQMGRAALQRVIQHIASLDRQPAAGDVNAEALCRAMREPAPEAPTALEPLLDQLFDEWVPRSYTASGPGYLAYIPGGGLFPAALADLIADGINRYTGVWQAAPALVQLEANVLDWMREWMGLPAQTRGLLTTGGSMATFNGVLCARERLLGAEIRPGVLYTSTQAHHSVLKAARLAGVMADRVRSVAVDSDFRLDLDALAAAIDRDRRAGLRPFMVVTSAGTTNTGAVDPLDAVADLCQREGLWQHVDGAYGGFFHLCEPLRPLLPGLSRADSLTLDPHKGLFLPFGTGALLVRDGEALRAVHAVEAGYLPGTPDPEAFYDPSQYGPELSRGFPGLRVWLCLKIFGVPRFRAALQEKRALALWACERAGQIPGLQIVAPPQLSLLAFQLCPPGADQAQRNAATRELLERVNAHGQVLLTGCTVDDGRFLGRVCVLSFRTRRDRVETCVEQLEQEAAAILSG